IERQSRETGDRNWDGIGFAVHERRMVAMLVEFSGGIGLNCGKPKQEKDVNKLLPSLIDINQVKDMPFPISTFCVRFTNLDLHFESLTTMTDEVHLLKRYLTLTCPTTPNQLKTAVAKVEQLFQWKHTVLRESTTLSCAHLMPQSVKTSQDSLRNGQEVELVDHSNLDATN
ncbi:hypothetical protein EC973_006608, partial [Apophysomyces ossiformis]